MLLAPLALGAVVFLRFAAGERSLREAALLALTILMVALVAITEILSLFGVVAGPPLLAMWLVALAVAAVWSRRSLRPGVSRLRAAMQNLHAANAPASVVLVLFGAGTLLSALLYPVVNYDSLTAHMPRVFFWLQNGSVAHYPTAFGPQLFSGTTTAFVVLHLKALSGGGDRFVNLAGWLSYAGAVLTVSLIALRLGAGRRGQQLAAVAAAATPMALLQASTTQTDVTTALWCLAAVYGVLRFFDDPPSSVRQGVPWALATGAALGLAVGAKASAYLALAPFFLWLAIGAVRRVGVARAAALAAVVLTMGVTLNAGQYTRNAMLLDGDVIASSAPGMSHILVPDRSVGGVITTALKNTSMLLGTPSERVNAGVAAGVRGIVGLYSGNPDDPRNAEEASGPYRLDGRITSHDVGPAPLIVALAAFAAAAVTRAGRKARLYLACAATALALTAGLVSWNLFVNRILLVPLLLFVPLVGLAAEHLRSRTARAALAALAILAVAWGTGVMALNSTNRLVPPAVLPFDLGMRDLGWWNTPYEALRYRVLAPEMEMPSRAIAAAVTARGAHRVGIIDHVRHAPVYCLLAPLGDRDVAYADKTLLRNRLDPSGFVPEVIMEIVAAEDFPQVLRDGTARGEMLVEPQFAGSYYVLLLYEAP